MQLINSNRFYLPGSNNCALHLATVTRNLKEYVCFFLKTTGQIYIEEITGGHLSEVNDDELFQALYDFLEFNNVLSGKRPLLSDDEWFRNKNEKLKI